MKASTAPAANIGEKWKIGFLLNPKQFLDSDIFHYENKDFPALAAAMRYYAFLAKILFYIIRFVIVVYLIVGFLYVVGSAFAMLGGMVEDSSTFDGFLALVMIPVALVMFIVLGAIYLIINNLLLVLELAGLEFIRVVLKIEQNTRNTR